MRCLHVTDLHAGSARSQQALRAGWQGVPQSATERIDFVVISGDIADKSTKEDYSTALEFTRKVLLPLVDNDVSRIVVVPGNHDIDWSCDSFWEKDASSANVYTRTSRDGDGASCTRYIDATRYHDRFASFFDHFYTPLYYSEVEMPRLVRRLSLAGMTDGQDWSLHVCEERGVAFFGFNSCRSIDKYNPNCAEISELSIINAQAEAAKLKARGVRSIVSVWHHGLVAERGRQDALSDETIDLLFRSGFRIFLHGHTHKDEARIADNLYGQRLMAIGTGSLGAPQEDRPGGIGNEFRLITIVQPRAHTVAFQRTPGGWIPQRNRTLFLEET